MNAGGGNTGCGMGTIVGTYANDACDEKEEIVGFKGEEGPA